MTATGFLYLPTATGKLRCDIEMGFKTRSESLPIILGLKWVTDNETVETASGSLRSRASTLPGREWYRPDVVVRALPAGADGVSNALTCAIEF